jgi:DNA-binding SARP family transcriptional activator
MSSAGDGVLNIRLLGDIQADIDGAPVDLGTRKQRAVFTVLALELGRVVSADQLVEILWADDATTKRRASLQAYVSNLRRAIEPASRPGGRPVRLLSSPPGYRLASEHVWTDVAELETASRVAGAYIDAGRWADAEQHLDRALALWRGPTLGEFTAEAFAVDEAARLAALRLTLEEWRFEARLGRRDGALAVDLERFIESQPLRERAWSLLIRVLLQFGREDDALAAYRRLEAILDDQVGIEPSPDIRQLVEPLGRRSASNDVGGRPAARDVAFERAERASTEPAEGVIAADPEAAGLARAHELATVVGALDDARRGRPRVVVVNGEAGIGKTMLVDAVLARAEELGIRHAAGHCQDDWAAPFAPWRHVLEALDRDEIDWTELTTENLDVRAAHRRLAEEVVRVVLRAADERALVVVLEDLHWGDMSSLRCLEVLDRSVTVERLLVIATCGDERSPDVSDTMGALIRSDHFVRVDLEPLPAADLATLVRRHAERPLTDAEVATVGARTAGNPLFAIELARWFGRHPEGHGVPVGIVDVVRRRTAQLPPGSVDVLASAAVIGASFDLDMLTGVTELDRDAVFDLVDAATSYRIIEPDPQQLNRYHFTHAVVRDSVVEGMAPTRRARVHHRIAEVLARSGGDPVELAVHRWEARTVAPAEARAACREAASTAEKAYASADATTWWERALSIEPAGSPARPGLLLNVGRSLAREGSRGGRPVERGPAWSMDPPGAEQRTSASWWYIERAIDEALEHDDIETAVAAATSFGDDWDGLPWSGFRFSPVSAVRQIRAVLERVPPDHHAHRARLLAKLSVGLYDVDDDLGDRMSLEALDLARRVGEPELVAVALLARVLAIQRPARDVEQIRLLDELLELRPLSHEHRAAALIVRCNVLLRSAARDEAESDLEDARSLARETGMDWAERQTMLLDSVFALIDGEPDVAEKILFDVVRTMPRGDGDDDLLRRWRGLGRMVTAFGLRIAQGRLGELEATVNARIDELPASRVDLLGPVLLALGRIDDARELAASDAARVPPARDAFWFLDMTLRSMLAIGTGDTRLARQQYEWFAPHAGLVTVCVGMVVLGPVDQTLGDLARVLGDTAGAAAHYRRAIEVSDRLRSPHWAERARRSLEQLGAD